MSWTAEEPKPKGSCSKCKRRGDPVKHLYPPVAAFTVGAAITDPGPVLAAPASAFTITAAI